MALPVHEGDEESIEQHYTRGNLGSAILDMLAGAGKDTEHLVPADLALVDEFHIGGRQATVDFAGRLRFASGLHLLDIGCGLGGPSRYFALEAGCRVTGIDITDEYVRVAAMLSKRAGLDGQVWYQKASAVDLPFAAESFDGAYLLHVGMNIRDKAALFAGVRRVLRPGSRFGIYDVMRESAGNLSYPLPWAGSAESSFVESRAEYRRLLEPAGFAVEEERSRSEFAIDFFEQMRTRPAAAGGLGLHLLMGGDAQSKIANMIRGLAGGLIAPVEMICRAA